MATNPNESDQSGSVQRVLADFLALNTPCDAPIQRARFERTERYNAFHDGLIKWVDSQEGQAALEKARAAALERIKARKAKSANDQAQAQPPTATPERKGDKQ